MTNQVIQGFMTKWLVLQKYSQTAIVGMHSKIILKRTLKSGQIHNISAAVLMNL